MQLKVTSGEVTEDIKVQGGNSEGIARFHVCLGRAGEGGNYVFCFL
jgi:hypothetical protein